MNGENSVNKQVISDYITQELNSGAIRSAHFSMLTEHGVNDYSEAIHSLGLNYITQIGRSIEGVTAVSEYPVKGEKKYPREVRPDSIWFDNKDMRPLLVSEFERFESNRIKRKKLLEKSENLLIAYHQLGGNLPVVLLAYWCYGVDNPNISEEILSIFNNGFKLDNQWVPGINALLTKVILVHAIATELNGKITINRWIKIQ
jgi:hypothetical protein